MDEMRPLASLDDILRETVELQASDLHLTAGTPPTVRVFGKLQQLNMPKLKPRDIELMIMEKLEDYQRDQLDQDWELDLSYSIPGLSRFRVNVMKQRGSLAIAFRVIPTSIPNFDDLGLPAVVKDMARVPRGLVLVTGPTGSGKSTTLAALVDQINAERSLNIVTIEEPIEFLHNHRQSIVKQREVGTDTHSFGEALRRVLRHDPDVVLIGEMRDQESIAIALTAAETGHIVFSTLHTQTATLTVHRIIDVFPAGMRNQIAQQLADSLQGVISQQLLPRVDGKGRAVAVEVLITSPAVRNLIREGKEHQLYSVMQTGRSAGMQTMDAALAELVYQGKIDIDTALSQSVDRVELERALRRSGQA